MENQVDIVFVNPGDRKRTYQELGEEFVAIEPPFFLAALAGYVRMKGFKAVVIDADAENFSPEEVGEKVAELNPFLSVIIVCGHHPSASTQTMPSAGRICKAIKDVSSGKVALSGLHPSALPEKTLIEEDVDFVIQGEGYHTICELLNCLISKDSDFFKVPGLCYFIEKDVYRKTVEATVYDVAVRPLFPAWDLLPMEKYRAHNWHCFDNIQDRGHYGVIYTSFGCPYSCSFCCVKALFGKASIRYRNPAEVVDEITNLVKDYSVRNLKIADELFLLNDSHYMGIVNGLVKRDLGLNIWAYARIDTIRPEFLKRIKQAGINWLGIGIETANENVSKGVRKWRKVDIKNVIRQIQDEGIRVGANYMFGLPDDTIETMQETLDLAIELNCEMSNFYCCMAYPGSDLFDKAVRENMYLPSDWEGYSQHSYETFPLATKNLSSEDILRFRDRAFHKYYASQKYLNMITEKFGVGVREHITQMTKIKLKRKLFGD